MAELITHPSRWDEASYQRFAGASGNGHALDVRFDNGDEVRIDMRALLSSDSPQARWETLIVNPFELRVVVDDEEVEVPWLDVRALADEQLAAHLVRRADASARHVGHRLRLLRERRRMTSRQLAERAGISAQSLSRIERGRHDVVFSTLRRLLAAMNFELADLAAIDHVDVSTDQVRAALVASGLQPDTVRRVLHGASDTPSVLARMRSIFGWSATDLAGPGLPPLLANPALAGRFKEQARDRRAAATYVLYAHKIALLADQAAQRPDYRPPPDDPCVIADAIRSTHGDLRFASVAQFCWEHGIVIVPLADRGQFHGACWLVGGRPVVVLKQTTALDSRWVFDLGHELCHVLRHLRAGHDAIVELEEIGRDHDAEEAEASEFSGKLLLGDADRLAHAVVNAAGGQGNRIWRNIGAVAASEQVNPGVLANYLAHRLDREGIFKGGWGAAANLQHGDTDAPATARTLLLEHLDFGRLTDDDAQVLTGALDREEDTA